MSGWHVFDKMIEADTEFPASNVITGGGALPSDKVPSPMRSRNMIEAHFKSLRCFRKWCRYMPFIIGSAGFRKAVTPE